MENPAAHSPVADNSSRQRRIELRHAEIAIDGSALRRTAEFSDGSQKLVALQWSEITRVVALKCSETGPDLLCAIVTGGGIVVVLGEQMDGFQRLVEALPAHLKGAAPAGEWRHTVMRTDSEANVTRIFARLPE